MFFKSVARGVLEFAFADLASDCIYAAIVFARSNAGDKCCKLGMLDVM
jgi:hypothetical protein